jgi:hypothetical protein
MPAFSSPAGAFSINPPPGQHGPGLFRVFLQKVAVNSNRSESMDFISSAETPGMPLDVTLPLKSIPGPPADAVPP